MASRCWRGVCFWLRAAQAAGARVRLFTGLERSLGATAERCCAMFSWTCPIPFTSKGGGAEIGHSKRGKGVRVMGVVDRHGLPLSVSTHAANHHEVTLVQLTFDFYLIEDKPKNLVGDKAYDSDPLDEELRKEGIEMIAPHRTNRTKKNSGRTAIASLCAALDD